MRASRGIATVAPVPRALVLFIGLACASVMPAADVAAQDLFELEVFEYEGVHPGGYEVEVHANAIARGAVAAETVVANHRPAHLSVEVTRGWTRRVETAVFIQTAPFGPAGSARFGGGHIRSQVRLGEVPAFPLRMALSAEYAFNRSAFDEERQALELRTIFDYVAGRLSLVVNPALELVTRGSEEGLEPALDVSARAAWRLAERAALTADYFSAVATTRHLQQEVGGHHLLFGGVDLDLAGGWELGLGFGHCVTSSEPWLVKSVVGYRF